MIATLSKSCTIVVFLTVWYWHWHWFAILSQVFYHCKKNCCQMISSVSACHPKKKKISLSYQRTFFLQGLLIGYSGWIPEVQALLWKPISTKLKRHIFISNVSYYINDIKNMEKQKWKISAHNLQPYICISF